MNIIKETILKVADNSGAKKVKCIGLYKGKKFASIGDIIIIAIQQCFPGSEVKNRTKHKAIIIRTKQAFKRGSLVFKFAENSVVLLNADLSPMGNRIFGPVLREISKQHSKITNIVSKNI